MKRLHLFEGIGIELEYMIVDAKTLKVLPLTEELIFQETEDYSVEVDHGAIGWSNELVAHVIELKTNGPADSLAGLQQLFHKEVQYINNKLKVHNAMLLPTASHPFFKPESETIIWPHEYNEVYALYDRIFNCKGHGWSNLQSMHINFPFANDEEFAPLHAAIRMILPLLPALAASSPIIEGKVTGKMDTRLDYYQQNQKLIPIIAGMVIPEAVYSKAEYETRIFNPIAEAIAPYDEDRVLDKHFLNSRGAIARFDRGAIEIRILDLQECPMADLAIAEIVCESIKWLIEKFKDEMHLLKDGCSTTQLWAILQGTIEFGNQALITDEIYTEMIGLEGAVDANAVWKHLLNETRTKLSDDAQNALDYIIQNGNLSERILKAHQKSNQSIEEIYHSLAECLNKNRQF
jgi:gamma-glutamyl:cysteine ligase YbdK (ATP-grasp superfamily)